MHSGPELSVRLSAPLPKRVRAERATGVLVHAVLPLDAPAGSVILTVDGVAHPAMAEAMPSPAVAPAARGIFWGIAPIAATAKTRAVSIGALLTTRSGVAVKAELATVEAVGGSDERAAVEAGSTVAICMATHEPPPELLRLQIESLRAQSHADWICLISDDASSREGFTALQEAVGDDSRFTVSRSERRLGSYENFQRALRMVPAAVPYVALSDQDDVWHPDKLTTLLGALGDANLVYSDMRLTDPDGRVLSDTYWTRRHPNHANFASLLLGNSVTGAASLFPRRLLDAALPFPPRLGNLYHDHWLALVARALGEIAYVPRPLYDYVQHEAAVIGHAGANRGVVGGGPLRRLLALRGRPRGRLRTEWRWIYFAEYCRMRLQALVLENRLGPRLGAGERRVLRLVGRPESSPVLAGWLAGRQLRRLWHDETLGSEAAMLRALAWRNGLQFHHRRRGDPYDDADLPAGIVDPVEPLEGDGTPTGSEPLPTPGTGLRAT